MTGLMNNELESIWKEMVMVLSMVVNWHVLDGKRSFCHYLDSFQMSTTGLLPHEYPEVMSLKYNKDSPPQNEHSRVPTNACVSTEALYAYLRSGSLTFLPVYDSCLVTQRCFSHTHRHVARNVTF
jgi:hypothetical protein